MWAWPRAEDALLGAEPSAVQGREGCPEELDLSYSLQLLTGVKGGLVHHAVVLQEELVQLP